MKILVKDLEREGVAFLYFRNKLKKIKWGKGVEGSFIGSKIKSDFPDEKSESKLWEAEKYFML